MAAKQNRRKSNKRATQTPMLLGRQNYILMAVGFALLIIGFLSMRLENQIDGFLSLYIAPWVIFAGFLVFGLGILKKNPVLYKA